MTASRQAVVVAARRTPVAPRGGGLASLQADELAAPVLARLLQDAAVDPARVDHVVLGNALYGGGNPARRAALRAGMPETVPALTLDTQCCSGLDAVLLAAHMIRAGAAECVLAGGTESFSRSPIRMHRPEDGVSEPVAYLRPSFAPPPYNDPDLAEAAARLAEDNKISRESQAAFAVTSHAKAMAAAGDLAANLIVTASPCPRRDSFTRPLMLKTALRAPLLAGGPETGLSAATIACEADGAAAVLMMSAACAEAHGVSGLTLLDGLSSGGETGNPALAPIEGARSILKRHGLDAGDLACVELMEAYAVQAMASAAALEVPPESLNPLGGALARGHPIGASGTVLVVQLFEQMVRRREPGRTAQSLGMALIAAAGGLGCSLLFAD
ncbi:thiolase family protein [Roseibium aggregatum]|uniref:Thiolase family protein n=1 Tax=Roseibium aggregatum TaxID=187304 RepID=A0A939EHE4_9HYPH|nr:acetyl-CoA C-acyltransferase [Roseibium aggregatum]MBN9673023.1 thiolase family protein [Roseibium aggregatum]